MMKNYDNIIFRARTHFCHPEVGSLLISQPFLSDMPFRHSVVLLSEQDSTDSFTGFVINKPSSYMLSDLIDLADRAIDVPVYNGGPVSTDHLFFIHRLGNLLPGGVNIKGDLNLGGDFKTLTSIINDGYDLTDKLRFFIGYSGWGHHQLLEEIRAHFWAVRTPSPDEISLHGGGDAYWHHQVRLLGSDFKSWLYHPQNPQDN